MSSNSLRHVIRRREHRERAQPAARAQRFGLLEKHKDYKLRAVDYHRKQDALRTMKEKAAFRNEDEFYLKMNSSKTKNGVHQMERKSNLTPQTVKIMKAQDFNYLQSQRNADAKKIEKAKQNMHFLMEDEEKYDEDEDDNDDDEGDGDDEDDEPAKKKSKSSSGSSIRSKHVIFVDKKEQLKSFSPAAYFDTAPELVNRTYNRIRSEQLQQASIVVNNTQNQTLTQREKAGIGKTDAKGDSALQVAMKESKSTAATHAMQARADQSLLASYSEIAARLQRKRKLDDAVSKLQLEKNLAGKGARKRIVQDEDRFGEIDQNKVVYKWKKERKR